MSLSQTDPHQFQHNSLELIKNLVPLSSCAFFLVAPNMRHKAAILHGLKPDAEEEYTREYGALDPLHPERFRESSAPLVTLDSCIAPHLLKKTSYYQDFMIRHNHRFVADIFLRRGGRIVAGISVMREEAMGDFRPEELELLRTIQPFLEYTLNAVYTPERERERSTLSGKYDLTERELDVLELVLRGAANKGVATDLNLGLATVKTHLHHIYKKVGVKTRSQLISTILFELND